MSKNTALILRLQKIRDLIDTRDNENNSDSLSSSSPPETPIPPTRLSHKKKDSKSSKSKNPPPQKHKSSAIRSEKISSDNNKSPKQRSKSTSRSTRKNYYLNKYDVSFLDDQDEPAHITKHHNHNTTHHHKDSKVHKIEHKHHLQDKYDFNENKRGRNIKYYNENPYGSKIDYEKTQSRNEDPYRNGYYYKSHNADTGNDKYKKSSNDYYYITKSKEEPTSTQKHGIYITRDFKTSKSPSPYKSIHDEVYRYDGILSQHRKKNRKTSLFDSSSEDELDKYKSRAVEKTRRYMQNLNLSSSSDDIDIDRITSKYRRPLNKENKKRSIKEILNEKDPLSFSDDSEFSLSKPIITRSKPTTAASPIKTNNNLTYNRNRYLANFPDSSSSSDDNLNGILKTYSSHLKKTTSKEYQPTKSTKLSSNKHNFDLSSSDDFNVSPIFEISKKAKHIDTSSSDDDMSQYNIEYPKNFLRNKPLKSTSEDDDDFQTFNYKTTKRTVSPSPVNRYSKFLDSDDDSFEDITNFAKFTLKKHSKITKPTISSSSSNSDLELNQFNLFRSPKLYDDIEISKKRSALKNVFNEFSSDSSSSSINIDDILAQKEIAKQTQRILDDDIDLDDSEIIPKRHQKKKTNLKLSVPLSLHSPEVKDKKVSRINKKTALDDDDDDLANDELFQQIKALTNVDVDAKNNNNRNDKSSKMNIKFSSSDSADDIYNKYSANSDQNIQRKAKGNQNNEDNDEKSSADELIDKYSKLMPKPASKKVEINRKEESMKTSKKNNDNQVNDLISQLKKENLLSSDEEFENILKKNNNNTTKTEVLSDSDNDLPEMIISKPSSTSNRKDNQHENEEEEENDNLTDELMERYKYASDITNSSESLPQNKKQSNLTMNTQSQKRQQTTTNIKPRVDDEEENEEERRENLDSTYDIIEDGKAIEEKIFNAFDETKEDDELSTSDHDIQSAKYLDSKITDFDERLDQIASDDESTKKKYESLHWKTSSDELPNHHLPHYFSSSTNENENENINQEKSNDSMLDLLSPKKVKDDIRIGRSPSNDIRVEDDIQDEISTSTNAFENDEDGSNKKSLSSILFNYNNSSPQENIPDPEEEEEGNASNKEEEEQKNETPKKKKLMNLNPLVIPTNDKANIENFTNKQEGSGVATPIKSPDDKLPGVFNSDNSSDDVFGLTQPSPKSITPSPFNSDAEIFDNENSPKKMKLNSSGSSPSSQQKKPHPSIPHPEASKGNNINDNDENATNNASAAKEEEEEAFDVNMEFNNLISEEEEEEFNEVIQIIDDNENDFDNMNPPENNNENVQTFEAKGNSINSNEDEDSTNGINELIKESLISDEDQRKNIDVDKLLDQHKDLLNKEDKGDADFLNDLDAEGNNEEEEEELITDSELPTNQSANDSNKHDIDDIINNNNNEEEEKEEGNINQFDIDDIVNNNNEEENVNDSNPYKIDDIIGNDNEEEEEEINEILNENQFEVDDIIGNDDEEEEEARNEISNGNQFEVDDIIGNENEVEASNGNEKDEALNPGNDFEVDNNNSNNEEETDGSINEFVSKIKSNIINQDNQLPDNEEEEADEFENLVDNEFDTFEEEEKQETDNKNIDDQQNPEEDFDEVAIEDQFISNHDEEEESTQNQPSSSLLKSDEENEEEEEEALDNIEVPTELVIKNRSLNLDNLAPEKQRGIGNEEEESDFDINENFDRLKEIVVEPRPFVHIDEDVTNKESPETNQEQNGEEEDSDLDIHDNYSRLNEIVVEPRPFVHIDEDNDQNQNGIENIDDQLFDDSEEEDDILQKGEELLKLLSGEKEDDEEADI